MDQTIEERPPEELPIDIVLRVDGVELAGKLDVPREAESLVIFGQGSGSCRLGPPNVLVARRLREAGMATLLTNLLTRSEELEDAHRGHLRFDVGFLARRLEAATRWAAEHSSLLKLRYGYFGGSTDAAAAFVAAARLGSAVQAIVSRGGRPDLAVETLERVQAPTLLIVGERDRFVSGLNRRVLGRLGGEHELAVVPGASHLFVEPGALEDVARLASRWFRRHLEGRG